jgi:UDP-N-acetylmuramoyl-L-alanyl-D-glutamate--2,6-diaminopimelate ligase
LSAAVAQDLIDRLVAQGVEVRGLSADSRRVNPGDVFLAYPGARADGRSHIDTALDRGAAAVLWERAGYDWPSRHAAVANLAADGLRALAGCLAHLVYGRPSENLWVAGVTGTNGKTSVSQWIARVLEGIGRRCGVVGTLGSGFPGRLIESPNTTPDAVELQRSLAGFRAKGAEAAAIEVSSIGLDQGRTECVHFAVAVFTNLTRDHLEYHGSMGAYAEAKARLFAAPGLEAAVLNLDDLFGRELARRLAGSTVRRIGYGLAVPPAGLVEKFFLAREVSATASGQRVIAATPAGEVQLDLALIGRFNVSNVLAVLAAVTAGGVSLDIAVDQIRKLSAPPGRMQMFGGRRLPLVVVDYAHTPDALGHALGALRETARARGGRLICIFGCGGERDPGKRPLMGATAARLADRVVVTSDNPRGEDPLAIIAEIVEGAGAAAEIQPDRAQAIAAEVARAEDEDVILIAGKGHEPYQEIRGQRLPFSDAERACDEIARRGGRRS